MDDLPRLPTQKGSHLRVHRDATLDPNRDLPPRSDSQDNHTRSECRSVRTATRADLPFIDALQKLFSNHVGFMPAPALEAYVARNCVLIKLWAGKPVGYLLGAARLAWQPLMRPVYQLCVIPTQHAHGHASALIEAWQNIAKLHHQLALQANCAANIPAHTFWPRHEFRFICHLDPDNARSRDIIVWRKSLVKNVPRWFIDPPHRAGHRGKKTGAMPHATRGNPCT